MILDGISTIFQIHERKKNQPIMVIIHFGVASVRETKEEVKPWKCAWSLGHEESLIFFMELLRREQKDGQASRNREARNWHEYQLQTSTKRNDQGVGNVFNVSSISSGKVVIAMLRHANWLCL